MTLKSLKKAFHLVFSSADNRVKLYIKIILFCKKKKFHALGLIVSRRLQRKYGVFLSYQASFDETLILRHPIGIIIGTGVKIGRNVTVFQNVTLGRSDTNINAYPKIGDNTVIYSGAVVVGDVEIGNNCIVGANAVVTKNIPDSSIAVGVPAKVLTRTRD